MTKIAIQGVHGCFFTSKLPGCFMEMRSVCVNNVLVLKICLLLWIREKLRELSWLSRIPWQEDYYRIILCCINIPASEREVFLRIQQNLMALPGQTIEEITEVHSHYMAIAQTREFFKSYPHIRLVESEDTAQKCCRYNAERTKTDSRSAGTCR